MQAVLSEAGAIEHILPLLRSRVTEVQAYAADALRCIAAVRDENRLVIAGSCIPTLIILLGSPLPDAQLSAAGTQSKLVYSEHSQLAICCPSQQSRRQKILDPRFKNYKVAFSI